MHYFPEEIQCISRRFSEKKKEIFHNEGLCWSLLVFVHCEGPQAMALAMCSGGSFLGPGWAHIDQEMIGDQLALLKKTSINYAIAIENGHL